MNEFPVLARHSKILRFNFRKKYNKQTNVHVSSKQNEDCVTVVCRKVSLQRNANFTILRINNQNYR